MPTTFHTTNFKNKTIDWLTGVNASNTPIGPIIPYYAASQPADPSVTFVTAGATGCFTEAEYGSAPSVAGHMSAASGGVTQLANNRAPVNATNADTVGSTMTFARIYTTAGLPLIDCSYATSGAGVNGSSQLSSAGVGVTLTGFAFKLPADNGGTLKLNASLINRLVDLWMGIQTTAVPYMGITTSGPCSLMLYSGSAPASADAAATGNLVANIPLDGTNIWAAASGGAAALTGAPRSALGLTADTIGYARLVKNYTGGQVFVIQGSVATTPTSSDFLLNNLTPGIGGTVQLNEATISI